MQNDRSILVRRAVLFGVPLLYLVPPGSRERLILPYVITYTALDAIAGIAMGTVVEKANALQAADQAAAGRLIDAVREPTVAGYVFYFATALIWFAAALAIVIALRKSGPRPALVLMGLGAAVFAVGHPQPTGPIGMGLFLAGLAWLELRPRPEETRKIAVQPT